MPSPALTPDEYVDAIVRVAEGDASMRGCCARSWASTPS